MALFVCSVYGFQQEEISGIINVNVAKVHFLIQGKGISCLVLGASTLYVRFVTSGALLWGPPVRTAGFPEVFLIHILFK